MASTQPDIIYVVWSPVTGPIDAYRNLGLANRHAETMVGVEVKAIDLRSSLPAMVLDDVVTADYDVDDPTPVVALSDIEDAPADAETRVVDVDDVSPRKR